MSGDLTLRLIFQDEEDVIIAPKLVSRAILLEVLSYVTNNVRKLYTTPKLTLRDKDNQYQTVEAIAEFNLTPIFISIPHNATVKTFLDEAPRTLKRMLLVGADGSVVVEKYRSGKKTETLRMELSTLKTLNTATNRIFADGEQAPNEMTIARELTEERKEGEISPRFGGAEDNEPQVPYKREKVPYQEGKSQFALLSPLNVVAPVGTPGITKDLKAYTMEEVNAHNADTDAWIVINGKIYDVTKYLNYHPGGKPKLMLGVGRDGTALFHQYHPWVNAHFILEKYQVGYVKR
eukprot:TRINITY_DN2709_c0_g2_i1.p1 TRINITY_DN2709_c0_g2~~TRINITY_DN2709_c0_g2_i1.p1  ORF type:complete len:291 (-),score=66.59 TRINITY_DN2709_c0_g2_i1:101-973(-)